jgi:outer membrane protein TolC
MNAIWKFRYRARWGVALVLPWIGMAVAPGAAAQTGSAPNGVIATTPSPLAGTMYAGSAPTGTATGDVLKLALADAIERGLRQNLGALLSSEQRGLARGERWLKLSELLPNAYWNSSIHDQQIDLATFGFQAPGIPMIVGPFGYFDTRAYVSQNVLDVRSLDNVHSASNSQEAAEYSYKDARELVVLAVGFSYLQVIADGSRIQTAEAQLKSGQALYEQASDQLKAGTSPEIDATRALVEFQTRQQQRIAVKNQFEKDKLALARTIGLPSGQAFEVTDVIPFGPVNVMTPEEELQKAYASRADYQSALAQVRAAEYSLKAARAEYYPTLAATGDYGVVGVHPDQSHGTFDVAATLSVPLFQGNKVHGDELKAEATLKQNQAQLANLRGQIDQDVRAALLDIQSAFEQVKVARSNVELSRKTLEQSRDRFAAGVTDNVEVIQAQESVASASESLIASLYNYNAARLSLARAIGFAEQGVRDYLRGK